MKLIGKNGTRGAKRGKNAPKNGASDNNGKNGKTKKGGFKRTAIKIAVAGLFIITAGYFGIMVFARLAPKPPDVQGTMRPTPTATPTASMPPDVTPTEDVAMHAPQRIANKFTFAVFGGDRGMSNTDVIMVATLDTESHKLNVVNIPRDTLVNVSWNIKRINSLYAYKKGPEGAVEGLADILGYSVDFYIVVDMEAFRKIVDAIDGIWFDVPVNMDYEDPAQNLSIHIAKGYQRLKGADALKVVRYRETYAQGDIKRIEVTQDFLMAAASQILENKEKINVTSIIDVFINNVKTNLTMFNLMWLSSELFKLDAESINFTMMPGNTNVSIRGQSYVTIYFDQWLELLNTQLNPFDTEIKAENLSILTYGANKKLYVTDGQWQGDSSWGSSSSGSGSGSSTTPKPSPTPTAAPTATPSVTPGGNATPNVPDIPDTPDGQQTDDPRAEPTDDPVAEPTDDPAAEPTAEPSSNLAPEEPEATPPWEEPPAENNTDDDLGGLAYVFP